MHNRILLMAMLLPACIEIQLYPDDGDGDAGSTTSMTTDVPSDLPQDEPGDGDDETETGGETGDPAGVETETGEPEPECFELGTASLCHQPAVLCAVFDECPADWLEYCDDAEGSACTGSPPDVACFSPDLGPTGERQCGFGTNCPDGWLVAC